jgi:hypothetical protein
VLNSSRDVIVHAFPNTGRFGGLLRGSADDPLGFLSLQLTRNGHFTGNLRFGGKTINLLGKFGPDGTFTLPVRRGARSTLSLVLTLLADGSIAANLQNAGVSATSTLAALDAPDPGAGAWAGSYACAFGAAEYSREVPAGHGWGRVIVNPDGHARLTAKLPDGTPFSGASFSSTDGQCSFFIPLNHGRDTFTAEWTLAVTSPVISGVTIWERSKRAFSVALQVYGSPLATSDADHEILSGSTANLAATLSFSGFQRPLIGESLILHPGGLVTLTNPGAERLTLTLSPNGIFKGTFIDPITDTPATFSGIILPAEKIGLGLFQSDAQSGSVELAPVP